MTPKNEVGENNCPVCKPYARKGYQELCDGRTVPCYACNPNECPNCGGRRDDPDHNSLTCSRLKETLMQAGMEAITKRPEPSSPSVGAQLFRSELVLVLSMHWLTEVVCDHEKHLDQALCFCGWRGEAHRTVGSAVISWAEHVADRIGRRAALAPTQPQPSAELKERAREWLNKHYPGRGYEQLRKNSPDLMAAFASSIQEAWTHAHTEWLKREQSLVEQRDKAEQQLAEARAQGMREAAEIARTCNLQSDDCSKNLCVRKWPQDNGPANGWDDGQSRRVFLPALSRQSRRPREHD